MFYGSPGELIAEKCAIALSTVYAYKTGHVKPSEPAASAALGPDSANPGRRGWFVTRRAFIDADGNETRRSLLHNYYLILQYCSLQG